MNPEPNRTDPERHRRQVRAANKARGAAMRRLVKENQARFNEIYAEEAAKVNVVPLPDKLARARDPRELKLVAATYLAHPGRTIEMVMEVLGVTESVATSRIQAARAAGYLPPPIPRRSMTVVPCPTCEAPVGETCRSTKGNRTLHRTRRRAVRELHAEQAAS